MSLDALGSRQTCADSILSLRRRGRHVQVGLLPPRHRRGTRCRWTGSSRTSSSVLGSHGMPAHAYPPMMDMVAAGTLRPDRLITRTIGLAGTPDALTAMDTTPPTGVTVIEPRLS